MPVSTNEKPTTSIGSPFFSPLRSTVKRGGIMRYDAQALITNVVNVNSTRAGTMPFIPHT